jgi:hypothetical protein
MPSPPFPAPDGNGRLAEILDEVQRRFSPCEDVAAAAFGAGLAWRAGPEEGAVCGGCAMAQAAIRLSVRSADSRVTPSCSASSHTSRGAQRGRNSTGRPAGT